MPDYPNPECHPDAVPDLGRCHVQPIERRPLPQFLKDDLRNRFSYHPPLGDQVDRYSQVREEVLQLGTSLCELCPASREREWALEKLDEVMMLANAAIARRE